MLSRHPCFISFLKASFYRHIGSTNDSKPFFIGHIHFYSYPFRPCGQAVPPLSQEQRAGSGRHFQRAAAEVHAFLLFPPDLFCQRSPDAAKTAVHSPSSFQPSIFRMTVNHRTAFPEQRPIHPRTTAHAYTVPDGRPFHRRYHAMTEGYVRYPASELIRKLLRRTACRYRMALSSCHNSITASHTQLFFLMRSYDHGGDFRSYGTVATFDQRLSTNLPFSFRRLDKKSICRTFRWCHPMPMSSFCIVKIKCLTL